ncbi:hypothetical protein ElyMa_004054700 [Elysia marginata]|uniref:Uncharacterized protein n=1 Tax=Elysia marginata TaxID=1093978 RepID=A0AAV4G7Z5_9GAST|nr:hypothetical protein ElyMa_004054700 [Elysia marginata]
MTSVSKQRHKFQTTADCLKAHHHKSEYSHRNMCEVLVPTAIRGSFHVSESVCVAVVATMGKFYTTCIPYGRLRSGLGSFRKLFPYVSPTRTHHSPLVVQKRCGVFRTGCASCETTLILDHSGGYGEIKVCHVLLDHIGGYGEIKVCHVLLYHIGGYGEIKVCHVLLDHSGGYGEI